MTRLFLLTDVPDGAAGGAGAAGAIVLLGLIAVLCIISIFIWILPGIIANTRKHHNKGAIWAVTLLAGWTFVGWVVALVWAFTNPPPTYPQVTINNDRRLQS